MKTNCRKCLGQMDFREVNGLPISMDATRINHRFGGGYLCRACTYMLWDAEREFEKDFSFHGGKKIAAARRRYQRLTGFKSHNQSNAATTHKYMEKERIVARFYHINKHRMVRKFIEAT